MSATVKPRRPRRTAEPAISHVHADVTDVDAACEWFDRVLRIKPKYRDSNMASFAFGACVLIVDRADCDARITIGLRSTSCDDDYRLAIAAGAVSHKAPENAPWGRVRAAYIRGPGRIMVEFEQTLDVGDSTSTERS